MTNGEEKKTFEKAAGRTREVLPAVFPLEFHILRQAEERYGIAPALRAFSGGTLLGDLPAVKLLAQRFNERRNTASRPGEAVTAGQLNAIILIDRIFHCLAKRYREEKNPEAFRAASGALRERIEPGRLHAACKRFVLDFPAAGFQGGGMSSEEYIAGETAGVPNRQTVAEEIFMLHLANLNPAARHLSELFDDSHLKRTTAYPDIVRALQDFFRGQPRFGPENLPLTELFQAPMRAAPDSLSGQLAYISERWSHLLDPELLQVIMLNRDIIREEESIRLPGPGPVMAGGWTRGDGTGESGADRAGVLAAYERFSPDLDWMPRLVLLAKNIYVWMDQLSKRYRRSITRLDQIPDEELDTMARWGFTGLWLIGVWERSAASRTIKRQCGNPEADASAYSVYDYVIAAELGGKAALYNLRERSWKRGIRLASDMVPNHLGIDARWVIEHPQWFIQTPVPPFPAYRFTGMDLSSDPRVSIYLEDGYWQRRDAAVVFKRVDRLTGEARHIYHGNDGTTMPWNDTAQLDFLRAEVREAVIQMILRVARMFPVIRFDAAMTLTIKHFRRLWYPPPGQGGAIPSRAGRGLSSEEFARSFPEEFWREVVDRVAAEVPDTLLLAEVFWLLEGYFVRTLGMHRVYNSAFMNMLKMEMNAEYRRLIKEILEFDPRILKRFVNFMNNPDEATAIVQFGKGDKYFGVCAMMVTMPGLPLFGHGQVEGLAEKYGMEYRKAYWDEPVDQFLVRRHEAEIFPLLKKRHLFSDVKHFQLYDFFLASGKVNEDVFAYSNRYENERSLIVYHNRFRDTAGWIRVSVARVEGKKRGGKKLVRVDLARGLGLRGDEQDYCIFKDRTTELEYIRSSNEIRENGLHLRLGAYQLHVFTDFRELKDDKKGFLSRLADSLGGRGVSNINEALKKVHFASLYRAFHGVFNPDIVHRLFHLTGEGVAPPELDESLKIILLPVLRKFLSEVAALRQRSDDIEERAARVMAAIKAVLLLLSEERPPRWTSSRYGRPALKFLLSRVPASLDQRSSFFSLLFIWSAFHEVGEMVTDGGREEGRSAWLKRWLLEEAALKFLQDLGRDWGAARREFDLLTIIIRHTCRMKKLKNKGQLHLLGPVFQDNETRRFLQFNWFNDTLWFSRESLAELLFWLFATATVSRSTEIRDGGDAPRIRGLVYYRAAKKIMELAEESGWRVKEFGELLALQTRKRRKGGKGQLEERSSR